MGYTRDYHSKLGNKEEDNSETTLTNWNKSKYTFRGDWISKGFLHAVFGGSNQKSGIALMGDGPTTETLGPIVKNWSVMEGFRLNFPTKGPINFFSVIKNFAGLAMAISDLRGSTKDNSYNLAPNKWNLPKGSGVRNDTLLILMRGDTIKRVLEKREGLPKGWYNAVE